jgi:prefoldin subunit 5
VDSPTPEQLEARIAVLERRIEALDAELVDRIAAIEAACRAFAVVFAIPRITPGEPDEHR